ncbi:hypothetical protein EDB92DRAFT_1877486 [Lactarius akahatsu]|uniref:Uncharacterized protein n=1 Tax=Lactarius akahatsu TaxID=416441 RepID=A0AAD4LBP9_9AGAM|nr:hypothetical protein EDB92DRAFT_1877486 [Lactarius akahatsu]
MAYSILRPIRHIYVSLHQDTDSAPTRFSASTKHWDAVLHKPSSYPVCKVAGHTHDNSVIQHNNTALVPFIPSPAASPLSMSSSLLLFESRADAQSLDNFHPTHQPSIENLRVPVSSPASATANAMQDTLNSGIITLPETSISPPLFPTSPPAVISLEQHAEPPTPSDLPTLLPLASSGRVLDNILPTATGAPSASPGPTSAPSLGAATEDDASHKPGFQNENDALDPFSTRAIHANTLPTLDHPPQPSLPLVTGSDVVITGSSMREPDAEHTGDHLRHPSHGQYDVV